MFRVGEQHKISKSVPCVLRVALLRAETDEDLDDGDKYRYSYCLIRYRGHDPQKTSVQEKRPRASQQQQSSDMKVEDTAKYVEWSKESPETGIPFEFELDVPVNVTEADHIEIEMWEVSPEGKLKHENASREAQHRGGDRNSIRNALPESATVEDRLIGKSHLSVMWAVNGFGGGYGISEKEPCALQLLISNEDEAASADSSHRFRQPYLLDMYVQYVRTFQDPRAEERSRLRWRTEGFDGVFVFRPEESDRSREESLQWTKVPFSLRSLEATALKAASDAVTGAGSEADRETVQIKASSGGNEIAISRFNKYVKEQGDKISVNGQVYQSVKTYRGAMNETRCYWDHSQVLDKDEKDPMFPYPPPVLMMVTHSHTKGVPEIVDAWELSRDASKLTQLTLVKGCATHFKRVYFKEPPVNKFQKVPKVLTKAGTLLVAVISGKDLQASPEEKPTTIITLRASQFKNSDVECRKALRQGDVQRTRQLEGNSVRWNQVFEIPIRPDKETYDVLAVQAWTVGAKEEKLLGTARVPLPWVFNGYSTELGPYMINSFQACFKLKEGDSLDPLVKRKYLGASLTLKFAFKV